MEQRLEFDDNGKLVARINNAITDGKNTTFKKIEGEFLVSADIVNYILAQEYDLAQKIIVQHIEKHTNWCSQVQVHSEIINDEYTKEIKSNLYECERKLSDANNTIYELREQISDYKLIRKENESLKRQIDNFNNSRKFYERKFDYKIEK